MNSFKDYIEFKKKKEAFKLQCFLMGSCAVMLLTTLLFALLSFPLFTIIGTLKFSFVMFILLITCVLNNGKYITYREYKRSRKALYAYLDKILNESGDLDNEMLVIMKNCKKFK